LNTMTPDGELNPANLKVVDLRTELSARNLNKKGRKAELVARLNQYLQEKKVEAAAEPKEEPPPLAPATPENTSKAKDANGPKTAENAPAEKETEQPKVKEAPAKNNESSAEVSAVGRKKSSSVLDLLENEDEQEDDDDVEASKVNEMGKKALVMGGVAKIGERDEEKEKTSDRVTSDQVEKTSPLKNNEARGKEKKLSSKDSSRGMEPEPAEPPRDQEHASRPKKKKVIAKIANILHSNSKMTRREISSVGNGKRRKAFHRDDDSPYVKRQRRISIKSKPDRGRFENLSFAELERLARERGIRVVEEEDDLPETDAISNINNIRIEIDNDADSGSKKGIPGRNEEYKRGPVSESRALRIDGFRRPFRLPDVKSLLEKYGSVTHMWMDKIRTHCYMMYKTEDEATRAKGEIHGLNWPEGSVKTLEVSFVTEDEAIEAARPRMTGPPKVKEKKESEKVHLKALDEIFRRTTAKPALYWLPLTDEEIAEREERIKARRAQLQAYQARSTRF